jgi:beta-mannosidase
MIAQAGRLGYNPEDTNPQNWLTTQFPARYIYEKILPEVMAKYSPGTEYHPGSPYGTPAQPGGTDNKRGDIHQWNVWHGTQEPYQNYKNLAGRFVSEFGMEAFPALSTTKHYLADSPSTEHQPFSSTVRFHNKAAGGEQRLTHYLDENLISNISSLEGYTYSTQLLQSEALTAAFVAWRRNWKGPGKEYTSGALVWQMNDCWPGTSWSIADHFYNPKLSYYAIKRSLAQTTIAIERISVDVHQRIQIWGSNLRIQATAPLMLEIRALDVTTGQTLEELTHGPIVLPPNISTELLDIPLPGQNPTHQAGQIVIAVRFLQGQNTIARFVSWPEPLKNVVFGKQPMIDVKVEADRVRVKVDKPVKGLELVADAEGVMWEDNGIDLVSGEEVVVGVVGLGNKRVKARWYGHEEAVAVHD